MTSQPRLRSVDGMIGPAVTEAVSAVPDLMDADLPAVRLAKLYAQRIDNGDPDGLKDPLEVYGPKLLAVLDALGMTPKARASRKGTGGVKPGESELDKLRATRAS